MFFLLVFLIARKGASVSGAASGTMNISDYAQYKETNIQKHERFAFNLYFCTIPLDFERVALHWHDEIELIFIKKGRARVTLGLLSYTAEAGTILIAVPGELHAIEWDDERTPLEYENIIFSPSILEAPDADWCRNSFLDPLRLGHLHLPKILVPGTELHESALPYLMAIDKASELRQEGYPLQIRGYLLLLFHLLFQHRSKTPLAEGDSRDTERVKTAITYIREHYAEQLRLPEAAQVTGYSVPHFSRFFKRYTGQTFVEYLTDYRLTAAAQLLSQSSTSISDVAVAVGFDNFSYFCRLFRKKYQVSPKQYRQCAVCPA